MFYIGIDGGSSFARLAVADDNLKILGKHAGSSLNLNNNSVESVKMNLNKLLSECFHLTGLKAEDCAGITIGVSRTTDYKKMDKIIKDINPNCTSKVVSDLELTIAADTKGEPGMAVISNSGTIGICVDKHSKVSYAGGFGTLIDDVGSTYWIGLQAIRAVIMDFDGRRKSPLLAEKVKQHFKSKDIKTILEYVYGEKHDKGSIGEVALIVKYAAEEKDPAAIEIEDKAAFELALLAKSLMIRNKMPNAKIVLSGNGITLSENIQNGIKKFIKSDFKDAHISVLSERAEIGGVYLSKKACE